MIGSGPAENMDELDAVPFEQLSEEGRQEYWATLALRHTDGMGRRSIAKLLKAFGTAWNVCKNIDHWGELGIGGAKVRAFRKEEWRKEAKKEWEQAAQSDCAMVLWASPQYPACLRELSDAPSLLYARGLLSLLQGPCIGVVGTRVPTKDGRMLAENFGQALSLAGVTVVSGMALGIDRHTHQGALTGSGRSIGVLGTGIDRIYPASNEELFGQMARKGLLVSEFPPDTAPQAANFPVRNRIISGLSLGVVVVEAALRSGSLVTARLALEQNREVFAVPGRALSPHSLGCQNLVREGARAVFNAEDILADLAPLLKAEMADRKTADQLRMPQAPPRQMQFPAFEQDLPAQGATTGTDMADTADCSSLLAGGSPARILAILQDKGIMSIEQLSVELEISLSELSTALLGLEMTGQIVRHPGARIEAV